MAFAQSRNCGSYTIQIFRISQTPIDLISDKRRGTYMRDNAGEKWLKKLNMPWFDQSYGGEEIPH